MALLTKPRLQNANITQRLIFNYFDSKFPFLLSRLEPFRASFAGNVNIHRNVYRQVDGSLLRALGVEPSLAENVHGNIFGCGWQQLSLTSHTIMSTIGALFRLAA